MSDLAKEDELILCLELPEAAVAASGEVLERADIDWAHVMLYLHRRGDVEGKQVLRQVIVYVVLATKGRYAVYKRGASGGEERLHDLYSVGIGGHVNAEDLAGRHPSSLLPAEERSELDRVLENAVAREVKEELGIDLRGNTLSSFRLEFVGWLLSHRSPVDRDHIGAIYLLDYDSAGPAPETETAVEDAIENLTFLPLGEISELRLEGWSEIVVKHLTPGGTR